MTPVARTTGYLVTAATWNQDAVDNIKYLKGQDGVAVALEHSLSIRGGSGDNVPRLEFKTSAAATLAYFRSPNEVNVLEARKADDLGQGVLRAAPGTGADDLTPNKTFVNGSVANSSFTTSSTTLVDVTSGSVTLTCPVAGTILAVMGGFSASGQAIAGIYIDGSEGEGLMNATIPPRRTQVAAGARVVKMRARSSDGSSVTLQNLYLWCLFIPYQAAS